MEAMTDEELLESSINEYNEKKGDLMYFDCPICKNKGDIAYNINGNMMLKRCCCIQIRRTRYKLDKQGRLFEFDNCRFDNFETTEKWQERLKEKCEKFLKSQNHGILLLGQTGCGKTHLCTAMMRVFLASGYNLYYMSWVEDSKKLKRLSCEQEEYNDYIANFKTADVLYIDDLFKGDMTEADRKLAFEIIDYRYKLSKSPIKKYTTIISSEREFAEIKAFDEAIAGRLVEISGKENIIQISKDKEKNYRLKGV